MIYYMTGLDRRHTGDVNIVRDSASHDAKAAAEGVDAVPFASASRESLAMISHEMRTPLNAILGYAQLLQRDPGLTGVQTQGLSTIRESGQHLLALVDDIVDLARIEAAKLMLFPKPINVSAFLQVVADVLCLRAEQRSLRFTCEAGTDLPTAVVVDDQRLRQVLLNLVSNAIKFTDTGYVALRVRAAPMVHPVDNGTAARIQLRFEVEDSGVGLDDAQRLRLFQPFEQVADVERRQGGAGLGLMISRQLVRLMGGDIQVCSTPGRGSLFWFELDLPIVEDGLPAPRSGRKAIGYEGSRKTVLVVDERPEQRALLVQFLTLLGFVVAEAPDGPETLASIERSRPDLVLADVTEPTMDAMRRLRRMPEFKPLPIIALSAHAGLDDHATIIKAGASALVAKPIDFEILAKAIGEQLRLRWIYADASPEPQGASDSEVGEQVVLPPEEIEVLHRLAQMGNMKDICKHSDYLKTLCPQYAPLAKRLDRLARNYQSRAITALVERVRAR